MATVVSIMDRGGFAANTDVIVVADPGERALTWVPRDVWIPSLDNRINRAYARGGHERLAAALAEIGLAVAEGLCLGREAVKEGLAGAEVLMPVTRPLEFWYPLAPELEIEDGRKPVRFEPPVERLAGERLHQWIGARYSDADADAGDLRRIERQQELLAVMLGDGFDFSRFLAPGLPFELTSERALRELAQVDASWGMRTFGPLKPQLIREMQVLVPATDA